MVKFLLKKSYNRKDLKEKEFKDLWNAHGVFTTMWIYGKPQKILFFKEHITNLIKSTKNYKIYDRNLKRNIFKIIKSNPRKFLTKDQLTKDKYRAISDFISGMTDRYAINLYNDNK